MSCQILKEMSLEQAAIERAEEKISDALDAFVLDSHFDNVIHMALADIKDNFHFEDATNSIILALFDATKSVIEEHFPNHIIEYYVNCLDSHLYIDGYDLYSQAPRPVVKDIELLLKNGLITFTPDDFDDFKGVIDGKYQLANIEDIQLPVSMKPTPEEILKRLIEEAEYLDKACYTNVFALLHNLKLR